MDRRGRILLVDDDSRVLFVLQETLAPLREHYEIVSAGNGQTALARINEICFDLVITDLRMPDIDGVELTETIRALNPGTQVIWITAYGSSTVAADAARLEVFRCLDKPLEIAEIRDAAREALSKATRKPEAGAEPAGWPD